MVGLKTFIPSVQVKFTLRQLALLVVMLSVWTGLSFATPPAPEYTYRLNGINLTMDWPAVANVNGYTLYYTSYPYTPGNPVGSVDIGNITSLSFNLFDGASYYMALQARQGGDVSGLSNIEYFIMRDHNITLQSQADLGSPRTQFGGGVIDGNVYSFGGYDQQGLLLNSVEIFDPKVKSYSAGTANVQSLADLAGVVIDKDLMFFGATGTDCSSVGFAEKYSSGTGQWTPLSQKPTLASGAPAVVYQGMVYLFGGWQRTSCAAEKSLLSNVEAYNPNTDSWHAVTMMPKALDGATVAVFEDRAYVMGGVDANGIVQKEVIAYDFTTQSWIVSGLGSLNYSRTFPSSSAAPVIDNTILLVGGWLHESSAGGIDNLQRRDLSDDTRVATDKVEIYNPRSRSIVVGDDLPQATANHLPLVYDDDLFIIGGLVDDLVTDDFWWLDISIENEDIFTYLDDDSDGDGFSSVDDCNDNDFFSNPDAVEVCDDGLDQDCDGFDETCLNEPGDGDADFDGVDDQFDNCPDDFNPEQIDDDFNGIGDVCEGTAGVDSDGDGIDDSLDNCPDDFNPEQVDDDFNGIGDVCEGTAGLDSDSDGVEDSLDNCPDDFNPEQDDVCGDVAVDTDGDGIEDDLDNCPDDYNPEQDDVCGL